MLPSVDSPDLLRSQNSALRAEIAELRARLAETEETLHAIRHGEVDAVVVDAPSGPQVYMLESAEGASNRLRGEALAHIDDAVIASDNDHRITFLNRAAERQYSVIATEMLGRLVDELYRQKWTQPADEGNANAALARGGFWQGEVEHHTNHGSTLCIDASFAVLRNPAGDPVGLLAVLRDITARKLAEQTLRQAKRHVEEANEKLEEKVAERTARLQETIAELESFSYSISHDMRAPLRAIQSFSTFLRDECHDHLPEDGKDYLRRIIAAAERMDRLIQDVLVYSRVARIDLPLAAVELDGFVQSLLESYPQFSTGDAKIEIAAPLGAVRANDTALTQCLANLLGNAIKFAPPGVPPEIRIWTEAQAGRVRLFVRDNGIGIPAKAHETIFGMFNQLDPRHGGTGIGLTVVRKAAERMGGRVSVDSTPGAGSTFCLELDAAGKGEA